MAAALIYGLLALAMFGQGLLPGRTLSNSDQIWTAAPWASSAPPLIRPIGANFELNDSGMVFQPFLEYTRKRLPTVPLWNPHIMAGRPFLADGQSAVLSPFSMPSYLLPRRVSPAIVAAAKVFVAAFGTFLLARALGLGFGGALLSGVVFGCGQVTVAWVSWPQTSVWVLLPWLWLLAECVIRRPLALPVMGFATVVALQFLGGHPETSYDVMVATTAFVLFRLIERRRRRRAVTRPALALAAGVIVGTALAAVAIVPFIELLARSSDLETHSAVANRHVPFDYLLGMLMPSYWGRPTQLDPLSFATGFVIGRPFYAGALSLMLAAAALMRPSPRRAALAVFGFGSLAVVVGFEPFISIAQALPGPVRTDRLTFLFLFAVALLAGRGLDDLVGSRLGATQRRMLLALSAALVCFPLLYVLLIEGLGLEHLNGALALAWGFHVPSEALVQGVRNQVIHLGGLLEWLPLGAAAATLLWLRTRRGLAAPAFATIAVTLVVVDLFKVSMGFNPAVTTAQAFQPATGAIRYLQRSQAARFAGIGRGFAGLSPIPDDVGMRHGLYDARGRDFPVIDRYRTLWHRNVSPKQFDLPALNDRSLRVLELLGVRNLVQDPRSPKLEVSGLELVYDGEDARVYRDERALPRAFLVAEHQVTKSADGARATVESGTFNPRTTAVTEEPIAGLATHGGPASNPGSASITSYDPERVVVRASTPRSSLLVLTDSYFPGWQARVDGKEVKIHRVDYLLRGVALRPGRHQVTFAYRPASYRLGLAISLAAVLLVLTTTLAAKRRERQQ